MQEKIPNSVTKSPSDNTYTSRPISITAEQWDGTAAGATRIIDWVLTAGGSITYRCCDTPNSYQPCDGSETGHRLAIITLEGTMAANATDWIIRGTEGEFYPCKDSVFRRKYQAARPIPDTEELMRLNRRLTSTDSGAAWAEEFCRINPGMDEGTMIGWFANAIETAKSIERSRG